MKKIETKLERDLFIVRYDPTLVQPGRFLDEIRALGFEPVSLTKKEATAPRATDATPAHSALIDALLAQARRENKPLVLEFSGAFCAACTRLEKETLSDPRVQAALRKVIFRKVMVEKNREAARRFKIAAIPQLRFLAPDATIVRKDKGVISVETMLGHLAALQEAD